MIVTLISLALLSGHAFRPVAAVYGGHCTNTEGVGSIEWSGICVSTSECDQYGGGYFSGAFPDDPEDVKCCFVNTCDPGNQEYYSYCDWTSHACPLGDPGTGHWKSGFCPGGNDYKCCSF